MVDLIEGREGGASDGLTKNLKEGNGRKEKEWEMFSTKEWRKEGMF